ncbi:TetR/AcrR family transcriptional regulator [Nocardia wallacei]|uniref:TetR/AcrR family transcriptional regulator n=1 Tax=Nocardia wallacei TaxID=480035 RepID=UPI0024548EF2|nr:TetR/AcrR family transcriptional regulator [Nocardia wallacei]
MRARSTSGAVVAGGSTKDAIRDAAIRLFSSKGFDHASLREVADAVGITKASLYYHYASKKDLLLAIIEPIFDDLNAVVAELDRVPYGPDTVREVLTRQLHALLRHRTAGAMCVRDTVAIINAIGDRYPDMIDMHRRLCDWLSGANPTPEQRLRASAALEVLGAALWSKELSPDTGDELIERVLLNAAFGVLGVDGSAPPPPLSGPVTHYETGVGGAAGAAGGYEAGAGGAAGVAAGYEAGVSGAAGVAAGYEAGAGGAAGAAAGYEAGVSGPAGVAAGYEAGVGGAAGVGGGYEAGGGAAVVAVGGPGAGSGRAHQR